MSDQAIKGGRKSIAKKATRVNFNPDEIFTSRLKLPADAEAEAKAKGWELRWVDAASMFTNGGQHKNGWIPYKRSSEFKDDYGFKVGNDPEGIVRRQSVILAWRSIEQSEKHRTYLKDRADRQSKTFKKDKAAELRTQAKDVDIEIHEGFDDNE